MKVNRNIKRTVLKIDMWNMNYYRIKKKLREYRMRWIIIARSNVKYI